MVVVGAVAKGWRRIGQAPSRGCPAVATVWCRVVRRASSQRPGRAVLPTLAEKMVMMASMDDHERKVVLEFCHLLEKSKQLFNGLRDLPQYGHKQWQGYFGRTFDVYTKLWKFQQQHR